MRFARARYRLALWIYPDARPRPPAKGRPMIEFVDHGWLQDYNERLHDAGIPVRVAFWINDDPLPAGGVDDGTIAHGWESIPRVHTARVEPTDPQRVARRIAFRRDVDRVVGPPPAPVDDANMGP